MTPKIHKSSFSLFVITLIFVSDLYSQIRYQYYFPTDHYITSFQVAGQSTRNMGLGGINLAVEDTLGMPFINPCKGYLLKNSPLKWRFTFDSGITPETSSSMERISSSLEYLFRTRQFFKLTRSNHSLGVFRNGSKSVCGLSMAFAEELLKHKIDLSPGVERHGEYYFTVTYKESLKTRYSFFPISFLYYRPLGEIDLGFGIEYLKVDNTSTEDVVPAETAPYSKQFTQNVSQLALRAGLGKKLSSRWNSSLVVNLTYSHNKISYFDSKIDMNGFSWCWENLLKFPQVTLGSRIGSVLTFTNEKSDGSLISESKFFSIPISVGSSLHLIRKMLLFTVECTISPMSMKINDEYFGNQKESDTMINWRGGIEMHPLSWFVIRTGFNRMNSMLTSDPVDAEYLLFKTQMGEETASKTDVMEYIIAVECNFKKITATYNYISSNFKILDEKRTFHLLSFQIRL